MSDAVPEKIGPYRVTGRLGSGGMGEVLRGHDDRLDRPVALKRVQAGDKDPEKTRKRFRREARTVARLSDAAIVQVYDWVEQDGEDWLVMELVEGRTLSDVLRETLPRHEHALRIAREVASGLAAAHEAGLVHRDLKAANVMLVTGEGTVPDKVKILDFGIAKTLDMDDGTITPTALTADGAVIGTIHAMSPEQAMGHAVDHRSDLFSLGILLYQMLSGESPFQRNSAVETLSRICSWQPPLLHEVDARVPEDVSRFVDHLLAKVPSRRPADARQVMAEIDRLLSNAGPVSSSATLEQATLTLDGGAVGDEATTKIETPEKSATRRWTLAIAAAVVLVVAGFWGARLVPDREPDEAAVGAVPAPEELSSYEYYQRGMALLERFDREGNIAGAIDDFQRVLAMDADSAPALAGLSTAYRLEYADGGRDPKRLEQALTVARQAVQADEYLVEARVSLAMAHHASGDYMLAKNELEKCLEIDISNGDAWWGLGRVAESQGNHDEAEKHLLHAVDIQPGNWRYQSHLGAFYYNRGRYVDAEAAFLRHAEITPDSYLPYLNLGACYYMQGRLADAAGQLQESLKKRPDSFVYSNLGTIQFSRGLYVQAVAAFEKAIENGGATSYRLWGNLGDAYRWTPDGDHRAREAYGTAIRLLKDELAKEAQDPGLHTLQVLYLSKLGECEQAEDLAVEANDILQEADGAAWFRLTVAYEVCNRRVDALSALAKAFRGGYPVDDVNADPELAKLRQDARYQRLLTTPSS